MPSVTVAVHVPTATGDEAVAVKLVVASAPAVPVDAGEMLFNTLGAQFELITIELAVFASDIENDAEVGCVPSPGV